MVETGAQKQHLSWLQRQILEYIFPYRGRNKLAMIPARWLQKLGLDRLLDPLLPRPFPIIHGLLPRLKPHYRRLPELLPPSRPRLPPLGLLLGPLHLPSSP